MESIIKWVHHILLRALPAFDLSPLPGKGLGKLRLTPEELLRVIHAQALAAWSCRWQPGFLLSQNQEYPCGSSSDLSDSSILLMALVQTVWRKSYEPGHRLCGKPSWLGPTTWFLRAYDFQRTYWERRQDLGGMPFMFFFLGLAAQLVRLGVITAGN